MLARLIVLISIGWATNECKKEDNPESDSKFIPLTRSGHPFGTSNLLSKVNILTQFVKSPIKIGYWFNCPVISAMDDKKHIEIKNQIQKQIRNVMGLWLAPMRSLSEEVIDSEKIEVERITTLALDGKPSRDHEYIAEFDRIAKDKGYQLGVSFSCLIPSTRSFININQTIPYIYMVNGQFASVEPPQKYEFCLAEDVCYSSFVLLHEFGHAFGLADTYFVTSLKDGQPFSVMASMMPFTDKDGKLTLASDDIKGAQWLYRYYHDEGKLTDCFYDDYELHETLGDKGCRPKSRIIGMITEIASRERHSEVIAEGNANIINSLIEAIHYDKKFLKDDIARDNYGNTALHLALIAGNKSEYKEKWLEVIAEVLKHKNCCKTCVESKNEQGRTFLQLAKDLKYDTSSETFKLLEDPKFSTNDGCVQQSP